MDDDVAAQKLAAWETSFRSAAEADGFAALAQHLHRFDLSINPNELVQGTIDFVAASAAFDAVDGHPGSTLLDLQAYDPSASAGATYAVTFDVAGRSAARVLTAADLGGLDFADLYGMPWNRHQVVGYSGFFVSRVDGAEMSMPELEALEERVTSDLRFDYGEDEINFWFDPDSYPGAVRVEVYDVVDGDD
jgi:hypothetical protein